ncbi:DMT family transporter [Phytohabitans flavus]|uniref:EamA domain-containing protein n=1 Tax=Phytohabitans flavus TaxID=1076124 RepID=A0A6F8XLQ5_9ACTN|nr:EamA family transporter [Phytohabitans flavus]BCB74719.1 hypothetical protein Pflav_011290 [Phytohabitans flavus]
MWSAVTLAALAAVGWGIAEFVAGMWARRLPVPVVLGWSKVAGMVLAAAAVAIVATPFPADARLLWAAAAGLCSVPALGLLYLALRRGSTAVVAPVAAVAATVPVLWGLANGERLSAEEAAGIVAVLAGVTLVSWPFGESIDRARRQGVAMVYAMGSALGIGMFYLLLHEASAADPLWATAVARVVGGVVGLGLLVGMWLRRRRVSQPPPPARRQPRRAIVAAAAGVLGIGLADAGADGAFAFASTLGELGSASVIASLYPAVTVLLGVWLLRERLHRLHICGVFAALAGGAVMAAT